MNEIERIVDQLERAYRGEAWHGPSLSALLEGVSDEDAERRVLASAHTIAELVRHIIAWQDEAVARLEGAGTELPEEKDWPAHEGAWSAHLERLEAAHHRLKGAVASLDPGRLDQEVVGSPNSVYHLLHGIVQHTLYHAGQVAILKKAL